MIVFSVLPEVRVSSRVCSVGGWGACVSVCGGGGGGVCV